MIYDPLGVRFGSVRLAVQDQGRSRDRAYLVPGHKIVQTLLRRHFPSLDPVRITDAPHELGDRALQQNWKQLSAVPLNYRLELFKDQQIIGLDVDKRGHQERNVSVCCRVEDRGPDLLHELPKPWCAEVKHRSGDVDSRMIVKQSAIRPIEQSSRSRELTAAGGPVYEDELHGAELAILVRAVMPVGNFF